MLLSKRGSESVVNDEGAVRARVCVCHSVEPKSGERNRRHPSNSEANLGIGLEQIENLTSIAIGKPVVQGHVFKL